MTNKFDPSTEALPSESPDWDTVPEQIQFEDHPDGCGTVGYASSLYFASIGGEECTCIPVNHVRIQEAVRLPYHLFVEPRLFVEKDFESFGEALAYTRKWLAHNHKLAIEGYTELVKLTQSAVAAGGTPEAVRELALSGAYAVPEHLQAPRDPDTNELIELVVQEAPKGQAPVLVASDKLPIYEDKMPMFPEDEEASFTTPSETDSDSPEFRYPLFHQGKFLA